MKYNIEIEVDDKAIKDSGMEPDSYIRQEMGWLEDSGIQLTSITSREEPSEAEIAGEITGNEGIYSLGNKDGAEYVANIFRSIEEPGYVNFSLFAVYDDKMMIIDAGFFDGYKAIEDCVRDLASYEAMLEKPDIRFMAHCSQEVNSIDDYRKALDWGGVKEPVPVLSWNQIIAENQTMREAPQQEALLENIMRSARNETPEPVTYKGIPLEGLDKHVSMAHSHFIGTNEGIDHLTALLSRDKQSLTPEQFEAMSALNSVAVMNYQICNGGLDQYYFNQCHKEREPFSESDVKLVNKEQQVEMLRELHAFGCEVFPERAEDNEQLDRIINDFEESSYTEPGESWLTDDEEEDEGNLHAPYDFDDRYYEVNDYLETLIESYAQYLDKSIEKELAVDGRETFYFSFGTSEHFPFELGWVEVRAKDRMEACEMYSSHYPKRDGLINCSFVYNESEWKKSGLSREELGHDCHQVITDWGPFAEKNLFDVPTKDGRTEKLRVEAGYWSESKNLTVTIYPNIKEPEYGWDYPMVEISEDLGRQPLMHAVVAERADYDIPKFLQESGLAEPTGLYQLGKNDFGEEHLYPTYEFKLDKLMEIDPEMTSRYLKEHGFTVDQAREYLIASKEEKPLDELVKEAKAKAAEKNAERTNPPQQDLKGIDR